MSINIAICIVAYNRLDGLKRLLSSLENAWYDDQSVDLIISIDKSKTDIVERFADDYTWKHGGYRVIKHEQNLGLKKHILSIGNLLNEEYEALIVLEDDLYLSPNFMRYVRQSVNKYYNDERIAGISLYLPQMDQNTRFPFEATRNGYDVFFMQFAVSWGQVWMRNQWKMFSKWLSENNEPFFNLPHIPYNVNRWNSKSSWLKFHIRFVTETNKYFVYPYIALSTICGDAGEHAVGGETCYNASLLYYPKVNYSLPEFDQTEVKYDNHYLPLFLGSYLGIDNNELTIDLMGYRNSSIWKRFVITSKSLPYLTVDSFSLKLKPWEANIMQRFRGNDIYLYDTTTEATAPVPTKGSIVTEYFYKNYRYHHNIIVEYSLISKDFIHSSCVALKKLIRK